MPDDWSHVVLAVALEAHASEDDHLVVAFVQAQLPVDDRPQAGEAVLGDELMHAPDAQDPRPALQVRAGLAARIARPVYYELAAMLLAEANEPFGLWSDGGFFRLDGGQ